MRCSYNIQIKVCFNIELEILDCFLNVCLFDLVLYVPVNNFSVMSGRVFLGLASTKQARINVSCTRTQRSDAGEARTRNLSVSSQALYH